MSLRALRHFVVVAEELHMHRAAERLHIAQPALSQQIKQLEQRLGVVLFSRANRRLTLTAAGEAFLQKTRLALEMADQAVWTPSAPREASRGDCIWAMSPVRCMTANCRGSCASCALTGRGLSCRWCRGCANALRSAAGSASGYRHHPRAAGVTAGRAGGQAICAGKTLPGALSTASAGRRGGAQSGLVAH